MRGRERCVFSICLVCAIPELILAIVIVFLFPFDRFYIKLLQFSSDHDIPVHVFSKFSK